MCYSGYNRIKLRIQERATLDTTEHTPGHSKTKLRKQQNISLDTARYDPEGCNIYPEYSKVGLSTC
jgi:hypothetical protein